MYPQVMEDGVSGSEHSFIDELEIRSSVGFVHVTVWSKVQDPSAFSFNDRLRSEPCLEWINRMDRTTGYSCSSQEVPC
jgi:hypothetical protein